jgi:hypothetical protein
MPKEMLAALVMELVKKHTDGPHDAQEILMNVSAFFAVSCDMDEEGLLLNFQNMIAKMRAAHEAHDDDTCPNCQDKTEAKPVTRDSDPLFN